MEIHTGHKVTSGKVTGDGVELTYEPTKGGAAKTTKGDVVLISTGRRPYTENLRAKDIGVNVNKKG